MSMVYAEVELTNGRDLVKAVEGAEVLIAPQRHRLVVNPEHPIIAGGWLE